MNETAITFYKTFIGKTINKITVLDVLYVDNKIKIKSVCPFCTKEFYGSAYEFSRGHVKSCGCKRGCHVKGLDNKKTENLTGKKFGKLTALRIDTSEKRVRWECQCDCGNKKLVPAIYLKSGESSSCGCNQKKKGKDNALYRGHEKITGKYWASVKSAAKNRSLEFSINIEYAWALFLKQEQKCALTKQLLYFDKFLSKNKTEQTASLDRIDSSKGYVEGNVQWIHKHVNIMKWELDQNDFIRICNLVTKNNPEFQEGTEINSPKKFYIR